MRILTLNTWQERGPWRERWELILRGLEKYDADIVGFQEVFNMEWAEEVRKRSGYPYLAVSGEHSGLIFFSRFKPVEQKCFIMKARSPHEDYLRYAFYVRVDTGRLAKQASLAGPQAGRGELALFNTHLSWKVEDQAARMAQVLELVEFVKQKAGDVPSAVVGDFNTAPDTVPVVFLKESRKWTDVFEAANPGAAGLTWDYRNSYAETERDKMAERRIDYIFVTEKKGRPKKGTSLADSQAGPFARIKSAEVVFTKPKGSVWPSDHFGVLAEFTE